MAEQKITWRESLKAYTRPRVIAMFFFGISAGLPFLLVFSTMTAWLVDNNIARTTVGFTAWIGLTYSLKFFWAPIADSIPIPFLTRWLGKRRSWILISQIGVATGLFFLSQTNPQTSLTAVFAFGVLVAFSSASQDVVIDAYRIEAIDRNYQGAMAAMYIFGYRVALLIAGAGALYIADIGNWSISYLSMAALMGVGILTTLAVAEPDHAKSQLQGEDFQHEWVDKVLGSGKHSGFNEWLVKYVACPFIDFFKRYGKLALLLLVFIGIYRVSDIAMGIMANPFYLDLGFTKTDIAQIGKVFGFFCTLLGAFLGGSLVVRFGIMRPLILGAVLVAASNLLFAHMATIGPDKTWLAILISADNISAGISNTVLIAYLSSLVNQSFTATQYALFSSLMTLPGKFISGFSGVLVDARGYEEFFIFVAIMGIPAIVLSTYLWLRSRREKQQEPGAPA